METMQGIVITGPGRFEYRSDLPIPTPKKGEVRLKVIAAGICGTDIHITRGDESLMSMITPPVILGHEFCGEIESCGEGVSGFNIGDYVSAEMHEVCYSCRACADNQYHACEATKIHGIQLDGAFADYVVVSATNVIKLPKAIPVKVAAFMDALGNAVHTVCKTNISGRNALVIGYGPIGAMACEIALFLKAAHIFIIDINDRALDRAKAWVDTKGVHKCVTIIDGRASGVVDNLLALSKGGCDVCFELSGSASGINTAFSLVRAGGEVSLLGIPKEKDIILRDYWKNVIMKGVTTYSVIGREMFRTWHQMIQFLESGLEVENLVTGEYPLEDFSKALKRFAAGDEQKVVLYPGR